MNTLSLGFSPCPNDTYIFHALVHGLIDSDASFAPPCLEDVETLNGWAMESRLDVTKLSFHALAYVLDDYCVLRSGSALGRGCGPLLVARDPLDLQGGSTLRIAVPGRFTTASLLFRMFAPQCTTIREMRFETIMDQVAGGHVDAGVIIHEGRFTYRDRGLYCLQDLGKWWEETSGKPIPLGCIAAKRQLGAQRIADIDAAIRQSLLLARRNPQLSLSYIRSHAQEIDERVMREHIDLYVNDYSIDLGQEGLDAVKAFLAKGRETGILPRNDRSLLHES